MNLNTMQYNAICLTEKLVIEIFSLVTDLSALSLFSRIHFAGKLF